MTSKAKKAFAAREHRRTIGLGHLVDIASNLPVDAVDQLVGFALHLFDHAHPLKQRRRKRRKTRAKK